MSSERAVVVHRCPPMGEGLMPCCGATPFERLGDRITTDDALVTCGRPRSAGPGSELHVIEPSAPTNVAPRGEGSTNPGYSLDLTDQQVGAGGWMVRLTDVERCDPTVWEGSES